MKVYTLVSESAFSTLNKTGRLVCDHSSYTEDEDNLFIPFYQWMNQQMEDRLPVKRPTDALFPLWFWSHYNGVAGAKPDLYEESQEQGYLLECQIDSSLLLQSDFMLWSAVLLNSYIPPFDSPDQVSECEQAIIDSRVHIFDLMNHYRDFSADKEERCIQACTWSLTLDQVVSIETINL